MTHVPSGPSVEHLLDDPDFALTYANGSKPHAKGIIERLVSLNRIHDESMALRALTVALKHDARPEPECLVRLLDLACIRRDRDDDSDWQEPLAAALVGIASTPLDEQRFRSWCRPLAFDEHLVIALSQNLPASLVAPFALEQVRGREWPHHAAIRVLAKSGRDDLLLELAETADRKDHAPGTVIALALDGRTTPSPVLGQACARVGLARVRDGTAGFSEELALVRGLENDRRGQAGALTQRLAQIAPEALAGWVRGLNSTAMAEGFLPVLRSIPGAVLAWLASLAASRSFADFVVIALGDEAPGERVRSAPRLSARPGWMPVDAATADPEVGDGPWLRRNAPELAAVAEEFEASDAGKVLDALHSSLPDRADALPIARALVDTLFTPEDLAGLFASCAAHRRVMRPELIQRLPERAFGPVVAALELEHARSHDDWLASLPNPERGWRALAAFGPSPALRGRARAWLAARNLSAPPPADRADLACVFGHQSSSEPVTQALVTEARRLLTDAFVDAPEPVEYWGDLARVVVDSGDADLLARLRRCWLVLLAGGREGAGELSGHFIASLDATQERDLALSSLGSLHLLDERGATELLARLSPALATLAARSPKVPMTIRVAAICARAQQPDFEPDKLDLSGAPDVLLNLLDPWKASERPKLVAFALERAVHLLVDQPLDTEAEEVATASLRALRDAVRRRKWDPALRREVVRKRLRFQLLKVHYAGGALVPRLEVVEAWLRSAAWVRDWPDGRLARDVDALAGRLDHQEKEALSAALQLARLELPMPPLEPEAELDLLLKSLVLRKNGRAS